MKKTFLSGVLVLCFVVVLAGCSIIGSNNDEKQIKSQFQKFQAAWGKKDFNAVYNLFSSSSKGSMSEKDFSNRLTSIYSGIEAKNIKIEPKYPDKLKKDDKGQIKIPYTLSLDTLAGKVKVDNEAVLVSEKDGKDSKWLVQWDDSMIFPGMKKGDKVAAQLYRAKRGEIKDRNGKGMAVNGEVASIGIVPKKFVKAQGEAAVASILNISASDIENSLNKSWVKQDSFVPIAYLSKDDKDKISALLKIPGIMETDVPRRVYPYKEAAAHLIGYVKAISADDLKKLDPSKYSSGDYAGSVGLEKVYEDRLKGKNGGKIYITDANGLEKKTIAENKQKDGETITLTINADMEQALYNEMKGDKGTATAVDPKTGDVLALVNSPSYDPNLFVTGISQTQWQSLNNDAAKPLMNRFANTYVPGSVFKTVTAAIGLKSGKITPDTSINVSGKSWQPDSSWGSYKVTRVEDTKGNVDLSKAFVLSDNIYFAQAALKIGKDTFLSEAKNMGIGEKIPFDFPMQTSQLSSDGSLKNDIALADSGYGQGQVLMNPLQLNLIYASLMNNGTIMKPNIVLGSKAEIWKDKVIPQSAITTIVSDLTKVIEDPSGTGNAAKTPGLVLAGKTGTPEIKKSVDDTNGTEYGWFQCMNADAAKISVNMMIEDVKNKGESHYVVPKVQHIMQQFGK